MNEQKRILLIKVAYWLGIGADALWAVGLLFPKIFGILVGRLDFNPDFQTQIIMGIGGSLMTGWTFLLLWAVRKPIERRVVILLTAFPVVFGMHEFYKEVQRSKRISKIRAWHNPDVTTRYRKKSVMQ